MAGTAMQKLTQADSAVSNPVMEVLKYWHLVEFFVPFNLDEICNPPIACLSIPLHTLQSNQDNNYLPWLSPMALAKAGVDPRKTYQYSLYLLPFDKNELTKLSTKMFPLNTNPLNEIEFEELFNNEGLTCFAKLSVDKTGRPNFEALSVSTLPWAMGRLAANRLDLLNAIGYHEDQVKLTHSLRSLAAHLDGANPEFIPDHVGANILTCTALLHLLEILKKWAAFSPNHALAIVIKLHECKELQKQPLALTEQTINATEQIEEDSATEKEDEEEVIGNENQLPILNSFYIEDLEKVINDLAEKPHLTLAAYLYGEAQHKKIDVYLKQNHDFIIEKLKPQYSNQGRWPRSNNQNMSLMQQLAINETFHPTNSMQLFSINGPPGTGKTTLLQDIIAENITQRARCLASFANAVSTFTERKTLSFGREAKSRNISLLDPRLTGYEMIVASSNNAAVENISKDLPLKSKLGEQYQTNCSYLTAVAAKIAAVHTKETVLPLKPGEQPWGMLSIALGNLKNRGKFLRRAFWGPEARDETITRVNEGNYLTLWEWKKTYQGPSFSQAKTAFIKADEAVNEHIALLTRLEKLHLELTELTQIIVETEQRLIILDQEITALCEDENKVAAKLIILKTAKLDLDADIKRHKQFKPNWFARLIGTVTGREYTSQMTAFKKRWKNLIIEENALSTTTKHSAIQLKEKRAKLEITQNFFLTKQKELKERKKWQQQIVVTMPELLLPSSENIETIPVQLNAFWQSERFNQLRSELFIAALNLHEAWLAEVLKKGDFVENIFAITDLLKNRRPVNKADEKYIWQSLFMWIPVVSSTFASIAKQFKNVGPHELGWLLVDEAGQAVPQAITGAIWRVQRTVVVGDPLQIEPVFTVPTNLVEGLAAYTFKMPYEKWLPSKTSIQVLADAANIIGAQIEVAEKSQWIGCPLRVHRRCLDPMFSVSNRIAYENKMINARNPAAIKDEFYPLGESAWLDVVGTVTDKQYVQAQGEILLKLFIALYSENGGLPNSYIITPFKRIKFNLQKLISDPNNWFYALSAGSKLPTATALAQWCRTNIGTVHTFQGKEAEAVILVLGGSRENQGAVNWASSKPNLLNVALTRAKDRIYIIGDFELWAKKPYFSDIAQALPRKKHESLFSSTQIEVS